MGRSSIARLLTAVALGGVAALAAAATASGAVYCVGAPCEGAPVAGLQSALDAAAGSAEADVVRVAPGAYDGPFNYNASSAVEISGAGRGATLLRNPAVIDAPTLYLSTGGVHDLTIEAGAGASTALRLGDAAGARLHLQGAPGGPGLHAAGSASLTDSTVDAPGAGPGIENAGSLAIEGVGVTADRGLMQVAPAQALAVSRSTFTALNYGILVQQGSATVTNSVVRARIGILASPVESSRTPSVTARHLTLVGADQASAGVQALNTQGPSASASVTLDSSVVSGFPVAIRRIGGTGAADVSARYSDLFPSEVEQSGAGAATVADGIAADPAFTSATDLRPRAGSPLVDAGNPIESAAFGPLDLAGLPRVAGGRRDIGAHELQPPPAPPPPPPPAGPAPDRTAPVVSRARVLRAGAARRLAVTISEPATATLVVERRIADGRRRGARCVAPARAPRRAAACPRHVVAARVPVALRAGANTIALPRRARGRALPAARYRVRFRARDAAGNLSREVVKAYSTVIRRPAR
ncbi:MAG: choice-of-anchor Q domain-containing protein [Thermoleophilia bacterium]